MADGKPVPLGDRKYLLSPQDLAGLELLPELARAGVASLKIEGRLKSPEYVANITRLYRQALDGLANTPHPGPEGLGGRQAAPPIPPHSSGAAAPGSHLPPIASPPMPGTQQYEMEMAFSRGLYTGWFRGTNNQALVHGRFGKKRGVYLGQVLETRREAVVVALEGPLKLGDGVVFDAGRPEEKEEGGRVYEIEAEPARRPPQTTSAGAREAGNGAPTPVRLSFGRGDIDFSRIHAGDKLWKTSDPELERRLRQTFQGTAPRFHRPLSMEVHGLAGRPLTVIARDEAGHVAQATSAMPLAKAETQPLTPERLRAQLGRLGGTPFKLGELKNCLEGDVLLPVSELNHVRRELVSELETQRAQPLRWTQHTPSVKDRGQRPAAPRSAPSPPRLIVLIRSLAQLEAALQCDVETVYCELEDPRKYREAVSIFRARRTLAPDSAIFVAPPRIFKMGEEWTLKQVRSCEADGYLVRNFDHLSFFAQDRCVGDYSLNIANRLTADYFKNRFRLERVTASYDLNFTQLEALLRAAPPEWFEVTIHQHMPMFHMEHCIFCAFLSSGTDYTNCGRPCDHHDVSLRDRVGAQHPVKADVGCRNTVFNALAQTGADYVAAMLALGLRHFRIEFLTESPDHVTQTILRYRQLLRGETTGPQLWRELKLLNQLGVTRGQLGG
jgi:putative protease